jgi:hypothetical protein
MGMSWNKGNNRKNMQSATINKLRFIPSTQRRGKSGRGKGEGTLFLNLFVLWRQSCGWRPCWTEIVSYSGSIVLLPKIQIKMWLERHWRYITNSVSKRFCLRITEARSAQWITLCRSHDFRGDMELYFATSVKSTTNSDVHIQPTETV